jgi:Tol biopolymer transport system component
MVTRSFARFSTGATVAASVTLGTLVAASGGRQPAPAAGKELPVRLIPNVPRNAEAYYAPDNLHVIAQTQDPAAQKAPGRDTGALTYTFTDQGTEITRINDRGQDACSFFFPDGKRLIWTSTRDNLDLPIGNWSDQNNYPQGAELYTSDLKGGDVTRLTTNKHYDAEVSVSPNGQWIIFSRQVEGKLDLWRMKADGTGEQQITFTNDWQEGAPNYLPDNETVLYRAWKNSEYGKIRPTPMTVFTIKHDGTNTTARTFDRGMNWSAYPAPNGRNYVYVRVIEDNNWEVFLGDLGGGEPVRLTYNPGFDGFPSISPDGKKMLFGRSTGGGFMSNLYTHVMDVSSLGLGPERYKGVPAIKPPKD